MLRFPSPDIRNTRRKSVIVSLLHGRLQFGNCLAELVAIHQSQAGHVMDIGDRPGFARCPRIHHLTQLPHLQVLGQKHAIVVYKLLTHFGCYVFFFVLLKDFQDVFVDLLRPFFLSIMIQIMGIIHHNGRFIWQFLQCLLI